MRAGKALAVIVGGTLAAVACSSETGGTRTGAEGGACYRNRTCDDGLTCNATDVCEAENSDPFSEQSRGTVRSSPMCDPGEITSCTCSGIWPTGSSACVEPGVWDDCRCTCGDGVRDEFEVCDGADVGENTCEEVSMGALPYGTPGCADDCSTAMVGDCRATP